MFDAQIAEVRDLLEGWREAGAVRYLERPPEAWPQEASMVLEEDTAFELGNPALASVSFLLWSGPESVADGAMALVGPDIPELGERSAPLAQVLMVGGDFQDDYEIYRSIRDVVYETRLKGFSVRTMPSRQSVWCRVSLQAAEGGLSFAHLGAALVDRLKGIGPVSRAEALFVTASAREVRKLAGAASGARVIVDAMMKMYAEKNFDCEDCDYREVCDTVEDLKKMRRKLAGDREAKN